VLAGYVVDDSERTDRVLADYRRTIAELVADAYYGTVARVAHEWGLTYYAEALEDHRPQLGDDLEMRGHADVPMGAMWMYRDADRPMPTYVADLRGASSVAHVHGKAFTGAESLSVFGRPFVFAPQHLKPVADLELALGVTRFCLHTSPHQPSEVRPPGIALAPTLGQTFSRHETWAEQAGPWMRYLARASHLLNLGDPVADVLVLASDGGSPHRGLRRRGVRRSAVRALVGLRLHRGSAHGAAGRDRRHRGLRRRNPLPPRAAGGLDRADRAAHPARARPARRCRRDARGASADRLAQRGRRLDDVRGRGGVALVVTAGAPHPGRGLRVLGDPDWIAPGLDVVQRRLPEGDVYFVRNPAAETVSVPVSLRATAPGAEFWDAVAGTRTTADARVVDGRTDLVVTLPAHGSGFVVLRDARPADRLGDAEVVATATARTEMPDDPAFSGISIWHATIDADPGVA
jgi:hypothetical protein